MKKLAELIDRWGLAAALAAALALRAAILAEHHGHVLFTSLRIDEEFYQSWALDAAAGSWFLDYVPNHGPGYAWALGILYRLFGVNLLVPRLFQIILGLGSAALVHRIGRRLFGPGPAFFAALLLGLYWPLAVFEQRVLAASMFLFLNLLGLHLATMAVEADRAWPWPAAGLVLGLAALTRVNVLPWIALLAAWLVVRGARADQRKATLGKALVLIAAAALPTLLVMAEHHRISGEWGPVQTNGGLNLYLGNNPDADGAPYARPGGQWDDLEARPFLEAGIIDPSGQDRFYLRQVGAFIRDQPGGFLDLLLKKAALLVNRREIRATIDPEFHRQLFRATRLPLPGFGVLLGLALAGAMSLSMRRSEHQLLLIFVAAHGLTLIATVVSSRYRLPFASGLAILAGAGAWAMVTEARARSRRLAVTIALFAAGLGLSALPVAPAYSDAEEHTYIGEAWLDRQDFDQAAKSFTRALQSGPGHAQAMIGLGRVKKHAGDINAAVAWLQQAVAADPLSSRAHFQLGIMLGDAGRREEGVAEMETGLARRPQWVPGLFVLAIHQLELGRVDGARANLRAAIELRPGYEEARKLLQDLSRPAPP